MLIFSTWRGSFELSRKIVTRLGGVTSSLCLSFPDSKLSLASFKPFYCCFRFCSECSHSWLKPSSHFYKNFQGFTYCSVFKVLCCFATARLIYHSFALLSTTFFKSFLNFSGCHERRRFEVLVPVSQGHGISYHPFRQKSTPFLQSFSNCSKCTFNF